MKKVLITGSLGLIGYTAVLHYLKKKYQVIGIDNDFRTKALHGISLAKKKLTYLQNNFEKTYIHVPADIRNTENLEKIFRDNADEISLVIHTAAQTSHDWSKLYPDTDFSINADATLYILENVRKYTPTAVVIFTSTNKVYGDRVNSLSFKERKHRFDLSEDNKYFNGIDEQFSIDQSTHSIFGVSKLSADLLTQEYARYYNLKTGIFRLGVVAGPGQSGAFLQGFLAHMISTAKKNEEFKIVGYGGKQVRDIIHAEDLINAFDMFFLSPRPGTVYNMGGGRNNSASILELVSRIEALFSLNMQIEHDPSIRQGDHQWWITNTNKFRNDFPKWKIRYSVDDILSALYNQTT